jgi:hypothetical protein
MANVVNYATKFESQLKQKYTKELCTSDLTTPEGSMGLRFVGAKTIKIPFLRLGGYKDHGRNGGFNRQAAENDWMEKTLTFDRDVEFFVDEMDVEETNQALAAANLTSTFAEEHAIPETDCYRLSKLYADFVDLGGVADTTAITSANILSKFDSLMEELDEAEVPEEGRLVYATPAIHKILKSAQGISRSVKNGEKAISREVSRLDDVKIERVPSARMKTVYNFTDGCVPGGTAGQINMLLLHPSAVIAADKHAYIKLWPKGTHTVGDGYLYQNRKYGDLFVIDTRINGIKANITPYTPPAQG